MIVYVKIKTPKGQASGVESKLRSFLLSKGKVIKTWHDKDDGLVVWVVEADHGNRSRIIHNIMMYEVVMHKLMGNKIMKSALKKLVKEEDRDKLQNMLDNETEVSIINNSDFLELIELDQNQSLPA